MKLQFYDANAVKTITTRSMELSHKRDRNGTVKVSCKTLDGIIKREGNTLTTRCAEIDKEMLELMGTSKAVLTNVIFCHQEDNCWPLSEGKVLKEKFDQIFGSIGYVKALAKIKKVREDKMKEVKGLKSEVDLHLEYKNTFDSKQKQLAELKEQYGYQKKKKEELEEKQKPLEEEIQQIAREAGQIQDARVELSALEVKLSEKEKNYEQLKDNIENIFDGTRAELEEQIASFTEQVDRKSQMLESLKKDIDTKQNQLKELNKESNTLSSKKGKLDHLEEEHQRVLTEQAEMVKAIHRDGLLYEEDVDVNDADEVSRHLKYQLKKLTNELKAKVSELTGQLEEVEVDLDRAKERRMKLEQSIKSKKDAKAKMKLELDAMKSDIDKLASEIRKISGKAVDYNMNLDSLNKFISSDQSERKSGEGDSVLKELHKKSVDIKHDIENALKTEASLSSNIAEKEAYLKLQRDNLTKAQKLIAENESKVLALVAADENVDEKIDELEEEISALQKKHDNMNGTKWLIQGYQKQINDHDCCPVCKRGLADDATAKNNAVGTLDAFLTTLPDKMKEMKADIAEKQTQLAELRDIKPKHDLLVKSRETVEELAPQIADAEVVINKERVKLESCRDVGSKRRKCYEIISEAIQKVQDHNSSLTKLASLKRDLQELDDSEIEQDQQELSKLGDTVAEVEKKRQQKSREKDREVEAFNEKIDKYKQRERALAEVNDKVEKHIRNGISEELKRITKRINEIDDETTKLTKDIDAKDSRLKKLREDIVAEKVRQRELDDNLQLFKMKAEIEQLVEKLQEKKANMPRVDWASLEKRRIELDNARQKLTSQKGHVMGEIMNMQKQTQLLEQECREPRYKNADKTYKEAVINHLTMEVLCDDLNKYYKALDKAVSTYHVRKMQEVNKLIDHFWKQTYQSADISTIKIVCDAEQERSASDKKRSFNYRVVMVRDNVEMDMRGRCSAGQKVLASLVIRIALAQIFCIKCVPQIG